MINKQLLINKKIITVKSKICEGARCSIYLAEDLQKQQYVLKHVICINQEMFSIYKNEAIMLDLIPSDSSIVTYFGSETEERNMIVNILFEVCPTSVINLISKRLLSKQEILIFFHALASAASFLHSLDQPVLHRDLRVESILVNNQGHPKISHFRAATKTIYQCDDISKVSIIKHDIEKVTKVNYRAPEMIDICSGTPIGMPSDIWTLGCTLYKLIYREDLFKPNDHLSILQGKFTLPSDIDPFFAVLIRECLQVDPKKRPTADQLVARVKKEKGEVDLIQVPRVKGVTQSTTKQIVDSGTLRSIVQERYKSWVAKDIEKWMIKATMASNDPPNTKHVRRVVLASIKQTNVSSSNMVNFLFTQRPWQTDYRIAKKIIYLVFVLAQNTNNVPKNFMDCLNNMRHLITHYSQAVSKSKVDSEIILNYVRLIFAKIRFHIKYPNAEGNFALKTPQVTIDFVDNLRAYINIIYEETKKIIRIRDCEYREIVYIRPLFEELANTVTLYRTIVHNTKTEISNAETLLGRAKSIVYLSSSIEFPSERKGPPHSYFLNEEEDKEEQRPEQENFQEFEEIDDEF